MPNVEPHRERGDNLFPRCAPIRGMHETSNADWWYARVTWQLTPLYLWGSLVDVNYGSFAADVASVVVYSGTVDANFGCLTASVAFIVLSLMTPWCCLSVAVDLASVAVNVGSFDANFGCFAVNAASVPFFYVVSVDAMMLFLCCCRSCLCCCSYCLYWRWFCFWSCHCCVCLLNCLCWCWLFCGCFICWPYCCTSVASDVTDVATVDADVLGVASVDANVPLLLCDMLLILLLL